MAPVLLALLDAHPDGPGWARDWLEQTLAATLPGYHHREGDRFRDSDGEPQPALRGWSVGAAWGNETLIQARPIVRTRDVDPLDDMLRNPASCVVAAFSVREATQPAVVASPAVKLSRFRRWLGVRVGAPLAAPHASTLRDALPGFLQRHQVDRTDGELVFLSFLAELHAAGGLRKTYSEPEEIRAALASTITRFTDVAGPDTRHNFMVSDGRTFAMIHQGGTLVSFEPPPREPTGAGTPMRGQAEDRRRTNLLVHIENPPDQAPLHGGERVAEGVLSIDVRQPRFLVR